MTLRDVLLACGNLKNRSLVIITDEHGKSIPTRSKAVLNTTQPT